MNDSEWIDMETNPPPKKGADEEFMVLTTEGEIKRAYYDGSWHLGFFLRDTVPWTVAKWKPAPISTEDAEDLVWDETPITVTLTRAQWAFVLGVDTSLSRPDWELQVAKDEAIAKLAEAAGLTDEQIKFLQPKA